MSTSVYQIINTIIWTILGFLVVYQIFYIIIGFFGNLTYKEAKKEHSFAFLIAGRNEEAVIGQLIDSIHKQNYDQSKLKIFVCADNCSIGDKTAEIARSKNAVVYERHDLSKIGKCYPLDLLLKSIARDFPDYKPDGFFVFDADNLLDKNYVKEMNKVFDSGEKIITSYRASKNYSSSLMSMGASISFIRECRFVHNSRNLLNLSTHVSGTGFLVSSEILKPEDGWNYGALTEDLEFSCAHLIKGHKVAYCDNAIFYDEQPETLKQTYRQRLRWQKGSYQCFGTFGLSIFTKLFSSLNFAFYDYLMFFIPLPVISSSWAIINGLWATIEACILIVSGAPIISTLFALVLVLLKFVFMLFLGFFVYGSLAVLRDWKRIKEPTSKKLLSMLAYPLFMIVLMPIPFIAIFKKIEWKPIVHTSSKNIEDLTK